MQVKMDHHTGRRPTFKDLFLFARGTQAKLIGCALLTAGCVAGIKTLYAVALGKTFEVVAMFGAHALGGDDFTSQIAQWCTYLVGLGVGMMVFSGIDMGLWIASGELRARVARERIFTALLKRTIHWFDSQKNGTATLMTGIESEIRDLQTATSQNLGFLVCDLMVFLACITVAFYFSWQLTLVMMATVIPSTAVILFVNLPLGAAMDAQKIALSRASKHATASITAIELVKVYNAADHEHFQYIQAVRESTRPFLRQVLCNCIQMGYIKLWMVGLFIIGFYFAVILVDKGNTSPGDGLTTFYAVMTAFQAIEAFGPQWLVLVKGIAAGQSLASISLASEDSPRSIETSGPYRPTRCGGDVELTNVSFAYPSAFDHLALYPSSFFFPSGEMTFLVGKSGSGKSTIANLLVRFYEPRCGSITIDDHRIETLDLHWLRSNVTLIQQKSSLFEDTMFHNIALGARDPSSMTKEEVEEACAAFLLQSTVVGLPNGFDTMLGSGGHSLSGGQMQRVALARAKLRDPPVLIFDEVTSGLDPISRSLIMEAIRLWRKDKTTIVITHEVSQIEDSDFVYVLQDGRIVQEGFKRSLARAEGLFSLLNAAADNSEGPGTPKLETTTSNDTPQKVTEPKKTNRLSQFFFGSGDSNQQDSRVGLFKRHTFGLRAMTIQTPTLRPEQTGDVATDPENSQAPAHRNCSAMNDYSRRSSLEMVDQIGRVVQQSRSRQPRRDLQKVHSLSSTVSLDSLEVFFLERLAKKNKETKQNRVRVPSLTKILYTVWPTLDSSTSRMHLVLGLLMCIVAAASTPAFSFFFANLLEAFWLPGNRSAAGSKWAGALAAIAVVDATATFLTYFFMERVARTWVDSLRSQALRRILAQPKSWFDKPTHSPSAIVECLDRNAEEMRKLVGMFVPIFVTVLLMMATSLTWALVIRWDLTLITLAGLPFAFGAARASSMTNDKWQAICDASAESTSATFTETFLGIRVVRALTLERHFEKKHSRSASVTFWLGTKRAVRAGIFYGLYQSTAFFLTALIFYYASKILQEGNVSATDVLRVVNLVMFALGTSTGLMGNVPQVAAAKSTAVQMLYYANLSFDASHEERGTKRLLSPLPVQMNGLQFSYPSRDQVQTLRNINLRIDAGTCTAIVGASGCGKSTIAALMLRLYEPVNLETVSLTQPPRAKLLTGTRKSRIYFSRPRGVHESHDRVDLEKYEPAHAPQLPPSLSFSHVPANELLTSSLRGQIAYVPQHPFLFPVSISDNILYGLHESSRKRSRLNLEAAAHAAGIHDFVISLPNGYSTVVGDGGLQVSGGQAQRISIARALVRHPMLLVMDEPTSALDAESAEGVRAVLRSVMVRVGRRMAIVVITHSTEMMRIADSVVMLEEGTVVETGSYDKLLALGGKFAQLVSGGH
ncbi:P-loop containing nucleoside triphosphate hydrolase protein [Thozetella sp. PMI_491]|nr:P-loop containing nucleoside triphosphate hydrolase protein [Thozetella sp. PMI_491]